MSCFSCGAATTNGLALCELCRHAASINLEFLPIYFGNLARWRPGRSGSRQVPGSREPRSVETAASDKVSRALDEAGAIVTRYALRLADDRCIDPPTEQDAEATTIAIVCRYLNEHLVSISTLPWCGDMVEHLAWAERTLRGLTESVVPGWYAGACKHCGTATYVVPQLTWVRCNGCGSRTYARDHLETILDEARGWVAQPKALASAIVALVDTEESVPRLHDRIRKWSSLGSLTPIRRVDRDGDEAGAKRYRMGEVLDLVLGHADTSVRVKQAVTG